MRQSEGTVVACRGTHRKAAKKPIVVADRPDAAWSWDITDLPAPWVGHCFKAYVATDIYSRKIMAFRVQARERKQYASEMFRSAFTTAVPQVIHADNGAAMIAHEVKELFESFGVRPSHSRPRVSNDNPFSESVFATIKTHPTYPGIFADLASARAWMNDWVTWYNTKHQHTRTGYFTPAEVYDGSWQDTWLARQCEMDRYYAQHPERFKQPPQVKTPEPVTGINLTVLKIA